ncbi:MAG: leucyl aminopeptidase, partial [Planctomycetes bacterium]|nr:leucyl aminopeptidase [Planctomycetota bacterium]
MKIQAATIARARRSALRAVLLPEGVKLDQDGAAARTAASILRRKEWSAEFRKTLLVYGEDGRERLLLVGLGKEKEIDAERLRRGAGQAVGRLKSLKLKSLGIELCSRAVPAAAAGSALAEGAGLASYHAPARRKEQEKDALQGAVALLAAERQGEAFAAGVERGAIVAEATNLARELGDLPGNLMTPAELARRATRVARARRLRARVLRQRDLERLNMGGILGVSRGSAEPPCLIELSYRPRRFKKTVCLVGKGLTFDSGGISIKPSANMEDMKFDMCGGAAVIGALEAAARLELPVRVIGVVPAAENMPSGTAQKPGDTLVTASGLTVEVINTDAEGRLILADGLHHAAQLEPDYIVDLATLTGACVVALGHDASGLYSNDERLT